MARLSLTSGVKFLKLVRRISLAPPFVRGLLETLWDATHKSGNPVIGDPDAVELLSQWPGEPGAWFAALKDGGWLDSVRDRNQQEVWQVHDYWQHAPDWVIDRECKRLRLNRQEFWERVNGSISEESEKLGENRVLAKPSEAKPSEAKPVASQLKKKRAAFAASACENPPEGFAEFWSQYPRKVAKVKAIEAWLSLEPDSELQARIVAVLLKWPPVPPHEMQFVPHPSTWLNKRRWEDESPPSQPAMRFDGLREFVAAGDEK